MPIRAPLYVGDDHNLLANRTDGDPHPQYLRRSTNLLALMETFVPLRRFGAIAGTGADMTARIQSAFDNVDSGAILLAEPGTYLMTTVNITRDDVMLFSPPGARFKATGTPIDALFQVLGTLSGTIRTITADALAGDLFLTVAAGDETAFTAGDFVVVRDADVPGGGITATHAELNQVKSTSSGQIKLKYPLVDLYDTAPRQIEKVTPRRNVHFQGGIFESAVSADIGASGILTDLAWHCAVKDAEFDNCRIAGVNIKNSNGIYAGGNYYHDAPRFEGAGAAGFSGGYGVIVHASTRTRLLGSRFQRLRHGPDVTAFSRQTVIDGNVIEAGAVNNIKVHPNVEDIVISDNVVDGAAGSNDGTLGDNDGTDLDTRTGLGNVIATLVSIDDFCNRITITGNMFRNSASSGIHLLNNDTHNVLIEGNQFENCNWRGITSPRHAAIRAVESSGNGTARRGIIVRGNQFRNCREIAVMAGLDDMIVEDNMIDGIIGVSGAGIWIGPDSTSAVNRVIARNNTVRDCDNHGIKVGVSGVATNNPLLEGNYIEDCQGDGIFTQTNAVEGITYRKNRMTNVNLSNDSDGGGIRAIEQSAGGVSHGDYVFEANEFFGSMRNGVITEMSGALIKGNIGRNITSASAVGFLVQIPTASSATIDDIIIEGNYAEGCATDGIRVGSTAGGLITDTLLRDNICINNTGYGIRIRGAGGVSGASNTVVGDNVIRGNVTGTIFDDGALNTRILEVLDLVNFRMGLGTIAPAAFHDVDGKADEIQQRVRAHTTQTALIADWLGTAGTEVMGLTGTGLLRIGTTTAEGRLNLPTVGTTIPGIRFVPGATATEVLWATEPSGSAQWRMRQDSVSGRVDLFLERHDGTSLFIVLKADRQGDSLGIFGNYEPADSTVGVVIRKGLTRTHRGIYVNADAGSSAVYDSLKVFSPGFPVVGLLFADPSIESVNLGGSTQAANARTASKSKTSANIATYLAQADTGGVTHLFLFTGSSAPSGVGNYGWRFEENATTGDFDLKSLSNGTQTLVMTGQRDAGYVRFPQRVMIGADSAPANPLDVTGKAFVTGEVEIDGAINHDGSTVGFYGVAPVARSAAYTPTNVTTDRSYNANATTVDELADVVGTLIADLQLTGIIG